jgi:hypothetical protein
MADSIEERLGERKSATYPFLKARTAGRQTSAQPGPCFPVVLVGALHSMRFSVKKTALATLSSAAKGASKGTLLPRGAGRRIALYAVFRKENRTRDPLQRSQGGKQGDLASPWCW